MPDRERIRALAERVMRHVAEVTPPGLGRWGWDFSRPYVRPHEDPYLDALSTWAAEDTAETRANLQRAAERYVGAWKLAGTEWERAGRPGAPNVGRVEVEA